MRGTVHRPRCHPTPDPAPTRPPHPPRPTSLRHPTRTHALVDDGASTAEADVGQTQPARPALYRVPSSLTRDDADAMESIASQAHAELALLLDLLPANAKQALQHLLAAEDNIAVCVWCGCFFCCHVASARMTCVTPSSS